MMKNIVTDTAQHCSSQYIVTSISYNYQMYVFGVRRFYDRFPGFAMKL